MKSVNEELKQIPEDLKKRSAKSSATSASASPDEKDAMKHLNEELKKLPEDIKKAKEDAAKFSSPGTSASPKESVTPEPQ